MHTSSYDFFSRFRTHMREHNIHSLQHNQILKAASLRGFSTVPQEAVDNILSETKIGTTILSGFNKDWRSSGHNIARWIVGSDSISSVVDEKMTNRSILFLQTYGLLGLPEGAAKYLSSWFQENNHRALAAITSLLSYACGIPTTCIRLPVQIGVEIFDISIRIALGLSAALCIKLGHSFSDNDIHNRITPQVDLVKGSPSSCEASGQDQRVSQGEPIDTASHDLPLVRTQKSYQARSISSQSWGIRSYKKLKWHIQWFLWRTLDRHFFYHVEGFKCQTHRMPSRSWFHQFTSEDPNQRALAYWGIRDAHVGALLNFTIHAEYIVSDPEKAYRSIELRYLLGYLFGDVDYDQMIDIATDQIQFLSSATLKTQYIYPILRTPSALCSDPNQFRSESKYIQGTVELVKDLYESVLRCLESNEVLRTLDIIPRHYYEHSLNGERKIFTPNFGLV